MYALYLSPWCELQVPPQLELTLHRSITVLLNLEAICLVTLHNHVHKLAFDVVFDACSALA